MEKENNIMLIGCGPHAKRIYIPLIEKYNNKYKLFLKVIIDIKKNEESLIKLVKAKDYPIELCFFDYNMKNEFRLNIQENNILENLVKKHKINTIIISSDPLSHKTYIDFAIKHGIHVLMDKPITTEINASTNETQAKKIMVDYKAYCVKCKQKGVKISNPTAVKWKNGMWAATGKHEKC